QLESALAAADAMSPAPPALVAHVAASLARVAASLGDRVTAVAMRERAQGLLANLRLQQDAERELVARLLAPA
ncbi:MAG TPA: hypothetical protein VIP05_31355, partial [Burkholderiaceae bacterium]